MKKIISIIAFVVMAFTVYSCGSEKAKKEVIVVPTQTKTIVVEKEQTQPNTTITLDKNGVKVEAKKVGVTIKH